MLLELAADDDDADGYDDRCVFDGVARIYLGVYLIETRIMPRPTTKLDHRSV